MGRKRPASSSPRKHQQMKVVEKEVSSDEEEEEDEEHYVQEGGITIPTRDGNVYIPPAPPAVCSTEIKGPRLIITHIDNENFKSYAGKQTLGPFHKVKNCTVTMTCPITSLWLCSLF